jgi:hypothetical protein
MSRRTVQRALADEGTSFEALLDDARRVRAEALLAEGHPKKEIAYVLGFADPSAFTRARRRWTECREKTQREKRGESELIGFPGPSGPPHPHTPPKPPSPPSGERGGSARRERRDGDWREEMEHERDERTARASLADAPGSSRTMSPLLPSFLDALGLAPAELDLELVGGEPLWRGPLRVDELAVAAVAAALVSAAELGETRGAARALDPRPGRRVALDARHAAASFFAEQLVTPVGWDLPPVWDPIAGDYLARDGWIRLHTNYPHHRRAPRSRRSASETCPRSTAPGWRARWRAGAPCRSKRPWSGAAARRPHSSPRARGGRARPVAAWLASPWSRPRPREPRARPRPSGRSGPRRCPSKACGCSISRACSPGPRARGFWQPGAPTCCASTPPSFDEVAALVPITAAGKRAARLDLASDAGREATRALVAQADVVVHGYRPGALEALGLGSASLHELRPGLVEVTLDAYGFSGPWTERRGFDSLVQHTVGITALTQAALGAERPVPLPCQALDHGAGWLMAAAVARGLTRRCLEGRGSRARTSLARVARALLDQPHDQDPERPTPTLRDVEAFSAVAETEWGGLRRLTWPGVVRGQRPRLGRAGALGSGRAAWG